MTFQKGVVRVGYALALVQFFVQHGQFGQQDGGLQGVQAAVHSHAHMVVTAVLTVAGDLAHDFGQLVVVGEDRPAVAVAAQGFAGEEAGACNRRQIAAFAAFVSCSKALGGVFNDGYAVLSRNGVDGVKVGALAVQAHGHDGFGSRGDGGFEQGRVNVVGARVDVHIHRLGPEQGHGLSGGDVSKAGGDNFVARAYAQRHLGDLQRVGAVGHGDAVLGAGVGGQLFFQVGHFRAQNVLAVVEYALNAFVNLSLQALVLGFEVDEFHGSGFRLDGSGCAIERVALQAVGGTRVGAGGCALPMQRQRYLFAKLAHPAHLASGHADHESVGFHVFVDHGACAHKGKLTNGDAAHHGAVGAEGGPLFDEGVAVFVFALYKGAGVVHVGKNHAGAAEDALFERDIVVHTDVVLHFAAVTNVDLVSDEHVLAEGHALADFCTPTHMDKVPDAGAFANLCAFVNDGAGVDDGGHRDGKCGLAQTGNEGVDFALLVLHHLGGADDVDGFDAVAGIGQAISTAS